MSAESTEFILLPKPLSESDQKVPSPAFLMPEKPCTGWPSKGSERPVRRTPSLPGTVPSASTRRRSGVVYLPDIASEAGASAGGAMKVAAGRMAWPSSVAVKTVFGWAESGRRRAAEAAVASKARRMRIPCVARVGQGQISPALLRAVDDRMTKR